MKYHLPILFFGFLLFTNCGTKVSSDPPSAPPVSAPVPISHDDSPQPSPTPTPGIQETGLPAVSPDVVYAKDWSELVIQANFAKTTLTPGAHFLTTRNACGREVYGTVDLETWNGVAKYSNLAIQDPPSQTDYCVKAPMDSNEKYMDGIVEIQLAHEKRTLLELKNDEICSTIADHKVADELLKYINKVIMAADKEECPNGWGSAVR